MIMIRKVIADDIPIVETLLVSAQLPREGVADHYANFFVAEIDGKIVGAGGLENCGEGVGLLRSFVVLPDYRNQGIASKLYSEVLEHCRHLGVSALYLLTTTAQGYFAKLGFVPIARAKAPLPIQRTQQFSQLCPNSAALMYRSLVGWCGACASTSLSCSSENPEENSRHLFDVGYFCAEAVLLAVSKHYGIESPLIPAIATGFCSGVSRTSGMCGALTGGILALNLVYGRDRELESVEQNYAAVQRLIKDFESTHGSTNCSELLGCHLSTPEGQQKFRERKLHEKCREYTVTATKLAVALVDGNLPR